MWAGTGVTDPRVPGPRGKLRELCPGVCCCPTESGAAFRAARSVFEGRPIGFPVRVPAEERISGLLKALAL